MASMDPVDTTAAGQEMLSQSAIERLLARNADAAYLTHYGRIENLPALAPVLHALIDEYVAMALAAPGLGEARQAALMQAMGDVLMARLRAHGCTLDEAICRELLANDVELNSQGLLVWLDREAKPQ